MKTTPACLLALVLAPAASGNDNGAPNSRLPPLGWSSWEALGPKADTRAAQPPIFDFCDEPSVRIAVDAFHEVGLHEVGYRHFHLDDCWADHSRNGSGFLQADRSHFPRGIKPLVDYAHSRNLTFGLYTCAGTYTCEGKKPGSKDHWEKDAAAFAEWGVDVVKMDWCNTEGMDPHAAYGNMSEALNKTGRHIHLNMCEWGEKEPWKWGPYIAQSWRVTGDHDGSWKSTKSIIAQRTAIASSLSGQPFGWNDMDMLQTGNQGQAAHDPGRPTASMTRAEFITEFSMWSILASPLLVTTPIMNCSSTDQISGNFTPGTCRPSITPLQREIMLNTEVLAINQDATPGGRLVLGSHNSSSALIYARNLSDGSVAVAFFNPEDTPAVGAIDFPVLGWPADAAAAVRDLWLHKNLDDCVGRLPRSGGLQVEPHSTVLLRLTRRAEDAIVV